MLTSCGSTSRRSTMSGFDQLRPPSALELTTVVWNLLPYSRDHATYARPASSTAIAGLSSKPNFVAGRVTRRTVQLPDVPSLAPTTRYGVRSVPGTQIDFSMKATYWRPPRAIATDGSPPA